MSNANLFTKEVISALNATQELQNNVHKLLETFITWKSQEPDTSMNSVKETIKSIQSCQSQIEKTSSAFPKLPEAQPVSLGNLGLITLDSGEDKSNLYKDLLHAYTWVSRLNDDASKALNKLKRRYPEPERLLDIANKRPKNFARFIKDVHQELKTNHPDLLIEIIDNKITGLKIVIKDVLCALVFFSGCVLDRVLVRSCSNDVCQDFVEDIWTPSKFFTFRQVNDAAQSAILNLASTSEPGRSLKDFVRWLSAYKTLFSDKCELCRKHLKCDTKEGFLLPPCWRDTWESGPYHFTCR